MVVEGESLGRLPRVDVAASITGVEALAIVGWTLGHQKLAARDTFLGRLERTWGSVGLGIAGTAVRSRRNTLLKLVQSAGGRSASGKMARERERWRTDRSGSPRRGASLPTGASAPHSRCRGNLGSHRPRNHKNAPRQPPRNPCPQRARAGWEWGRRNWPARIHLGARGERAGTASHRG